MPDPGTLIANARRHQTSTRLCLRGDLLAAHQSAEDDLGDLLRQGDNPTTLPDPAAVFALSERIQGLEAEIAESTFKVCFTALPRPAWEALTEAHPPRDGHDEEWNEAAFVPALITACMTDPVLTEAQLAGLFDVINEGQRDSLFEAAFAANQESTTVPFSLRASAVTRWRAQN